MIGTAEEVAIDLVMAALSTLVTQETDGNEQKQERLRHCTTLNIQIDTSPLVIRGFDFHEEGKAAEMLFEITDGRAKWLTWAQELGLRVHQCMTNNATAGRE